MMCRWQSSISGIALRTFIQMRLVHGLPGRAAIVAGNSLTTAATGTGYAYI
jgi:hypothetical protein